MTVPTEGQDMDGDAMDLRIARVLLTLREAVAQATETAYRDVVALVDAADGEELRHTPQRRDWPA